MLQICPLQGTHLLFLMPWPQLYRIPLGVKEVLHRCIMGNQMMPVQGLKSTCWLPVSEIWGSFWRNWFAFTSIFSFWLLWIVLLLLMYLYLFECLLSVLLGEMLISFLTPEVVKCMGWTSKTLYQMKVRHTKNHMVWFPLYGISKTGKTIETRSRLVVARSQGNGYRALFWDDENVLKLDRSRGCVTLWVHRH